MSLDDDWCDRDIQKNERAKCSVLPEYRKTVDMCQKAEKAGVSWITVHGRTIEQRSEPCAFETIKLVRRHNPVNIKKCFSSENI
jgi:hypothetical protein